MNLILVLLLCILHQAIACQTGACDPPGGSLLIGRNDRLKATSQKTGHPVSNIISSDGSYFESEENVKSVSITFDVEDVMQLRSLRIDFPTPQDKPGGIVIERSLDHGHRFMTYHYAARDCDEDFYFCETLNGTSSSITFTVVPEGDTTSIHKKFYFSKITNLRINFTGFGRLSSRKSYRVQQLQVIGSCLCYGHAKECETSADGKILPVCKCQHNTNGTNCDSCKDLFNDRKWDIGSGADQNECVKCKCNERAESCFFDDQVFEASGDKSGGVCLGCRNSTGSQCQTCRSFFYKDSESCRACACSDTGSLSNLCDGTTGQCDCLPKYSGRDCGTRDSI